MTNEQLFKLLENMERAATKEVKTLTPATIMLGFNDWQGWLLADSPLGQQVVNRIDNNGPINPLAEIIRANL